MKLYVGFNSTWSLRVWICAQLAGVEVATAVLPLSGVGHKQRLIAATNSGLVPALIVNDTVISDSLAIAEYLNEISSGSLYPEAKMQRAVARSLVSELHAGFYSLREACPVTMEPVKPVGRSAAINQEVERIEVIFAQAQGEFMFSQPTIVDAFYAILAYRLQSYGISLSCRAGEYQHSLLNWSLLQRAIQENIGWGSSSK